MASGSFKAGATPSGELRRWTVAAGVVVDGGNVLMVQNLRRNGSLDWSTPGGVVEAGEAIVDGLSREVSDWTGPVYRVETVAADMGWHLTVEVFHAQAWAGDVLIDDPDGIVVDAQFLSFGACQAALEGTPRWVHEPLIEYLQMVFPVDNAIGVGLPDVRTYSYELSGATRDSMTVIRK
jgi:8-oxo-dGTP diphosphatase